MAMQPLIETRAVTKTYPAPAGAAATPVLSEVSLQLMPGESVAIVGPSGSGKSTLLNLLGGLDRPTSGTVLFNGQDLATLKEDALALYRNREVGFVFQLHHLLPQLTALENVLVPTLVHPDKLAVEALRRRATDLLTRVGLGARLNYRPAQLSGGERQRVAVVRALINQPRLLLADEPTGALDQTGARELAQLLVELNHEHAATLVVVTHAPEVAALMSRRCHLAAARLTEG